jgi:alkanesulfonate monooxygenase SsuD/methylene tetrahydromethanopterin reductase-like flavin-dependent oxidoreductase (luciferase family)
MELGAHLPLMEFGGEGQSLARVGAATDAARDCGFAAVSANDHFLFGTPWLDGPTALAAVIERSGTMELATTIALVSLRGPVALAKALAAIDVLSGGRLVAGLGPGSSAADYEAVGFPFDERWKRFDEAVRDLRALLRGESEIELAPTPVREGGIPLWIGSWGSDAGLRRVARLADGWLASAYNTTPDGFATAGERLDGELRDRGREPEGFPKALGTMWTWVTEDRADRDRVLGETLAPLLRRDPEELGDQVCVGSAEHCAELLTRYAKAGCGRVFVWPLGDEARQLELVASEVAPRIES